MPISSVLIRCAPGRLDDVRRESERFDWFEAHQADASQSRFIGIVDASDTDAEVACFRKLRDLPGVVDVCLISHYFEDELPAQDAAPL